MRPVALAPPPQTPAHGLLQVAEVCVAALVEPEASNKIVEVIAERNALVMTMAELFESVRPDVV